MIYIGQFKQLIDREITAVFEDGAIYLTNEQDDDRDMIDDIIHEIAHSIENIYASVIYDDNEISIEFLKKKKRIYSELESYDFNPPLDLQTSLEFSQEIDDYLYKEVGYDVLWNFVGGIFPSPYAITSLREYFARGFEEYTMGNERELSKECPALYRKIKALYELEE